MTEGKGGTGACGTGEGGTEGGGEFAMIVGPGIVGSGGGGGELAMIVDGPVGVRGSRLLASNTLYYSGV